MRVGEPRSQAETGLATLGEAPFRIPVPQPRRAASTEPFWTVCPGPRDSPPSENERRDAQSGSRGCNGSPGCFTAALFWPTTRLAVLEGRKAGDAAARAAIAAEN